MARASSLPAGRPAWPRRFFLVTAAPRSQLLRVSAGGVEVEVAVRVVPGRGVRPHREIDRDAPVDSPWPPRPAAGADQHQRRAHPQAPERGDRRVRAVGRGDVDPVARLVGAAGVDLVVGQRGLGLNSRPSGSSSS